MFSRFMCGSGNQDRTRRARRRPPSKRSPLRGKLALEQLELRQLLSLTINATFADNIKNDPNAAAIEDTINRTIAVYEGLISNNVTVDITFQEGGGLGGSGGGLQYFEKYQDYYNALVSHKTTADDTSAINSLPNQANDPVNGNDRIAVRSPLARALGFNDPNAGGAAGDGTITLNTAICNLDRTGTQDSTKYDLQAVTAHEIDEILGFGSSLDAANNGDAAPTGRIKPDDLYRYDQNGARSYSTTATDQAYFSIDGGTTDIARFNQTHTTKNSGDYGDWYSFFGGQTPQVQDAFNTQGAQANMGAELRRLDVLGYTLTNLNAATITGPGNQTANEGAQKDVDLGSFSDSVGAPWGVTVDWGDGSQNTTFNLNTQGSLGSQPHTYAEEGTYHVTVTVNDFTNQASTETFDVTVNDQNVVASGGKTISPAEGSSSGSVLIATFTDPGGPESLGDYSADINWGDGTGTQVGAGAITLNGSTFEVRGTHTYAEESSAGNPYNITITIHHDSTTPQTVTSSANVTDPAVVQAGSSSVSAVEGASFGPVQLVTFTDPGGAEPNANDSSGTLADHYSIVSIDWGDGTPLDTTTGSIAYSGAQGSKTDPFTVSGSHTYGEEGSYTIKVVIDHEGVQSTLTDTATVSDPAVAANGVAVFATACNPLTGVPIAMFTDSGGAEPNSSDPSGTVADHYKVDSIDWGDGTALDTSSGAVSFSGTAGSKTDPFTVTGNHTYETEGTFTITAVLNHEGKLTTVTTTAIVKDKLGLLLLDPSGSAALSVTGQGNVTVQRDCGAIVVNSSNPTNAAFVAGNGVVSADDFDVTGRVTAQGNAVIPGTVDHEAATVDPLGLIPPSPLPSAPVGNTATVLHPGTYAGGIHLSSGNVTLTPGVYVMQGGGFSLSGKASVTGNGVVIINVPSGPSDTITIGGKAKLSLSAPTSGTYQGVSIVQVSPAPVSVSGQASVVIAGVVYLPNSLVQIDGYAVVMITPGPGTPTLPPIAGAMIAFDLKVSGNGVLNIDPDDPPAAGASSEIGGGGLASSTPPSAQDGLIAVIPPPSSDKKTS